MGGKSMSGMNNECDRLLGRVDDWMEELLLRGTNQFALEDATRLDRMADEAGRLGMEFLESLLRRLSQTGEQSRLATSHAEQVESEKLASLFFRLCGYTELARQSMGGSDETTSEEREAEQTEAELLET